MTAVTALDLGWDFKLLDEDGENPAPAGVGAIVQVVRSDGASPVPTTNGAALMAAVGGYITQMTDANNRQAAELAEAAKHLEAVLGVLTERGGFTWAQDKRLVEDARTFLDSLNR